MSVPSIHASGSGRLRHLPEFDENRVDSPETRDNHHVGGTSGSEERELQLLDLAVVCVTWNSEDHLPALLRSLDAGLDGLVWRLWVVDNGSVDTTVAVVDGLLPEAVVVQTGFNAGYAAAINAGVRAVPPRTPVLVLNPDVRLDSGCGVALLRTLHSGGGRTGIAVPVQRDTDGRLHPTLRRSPAVVRALGESLLGGRRAGRLGVGEMVMDPQAYRADAQVDWATGSVMAISHSCLKAVGEWDERFFLYSEETDFAQRAADRGYVLRLAPVATCEHARGDSHTRPTLWALLTTNRVRLFAKRHNGPHTFAFLMALLLGELLRSLRGSATHRAAVAALLRGERGSAALIRNLQEQPSSASSDLRSD